MRPLIVGILYCLMLAGCTMDSDKSGRYKGYEQAPYMVVRQDGAVEIRDYASILVAEVTVSGERDAAISQGFRILAGYIFGGNVPSAKIAMTTPVTQQAGASDQKGETIAMTTPVTQSGTDESWVVQFMMPSRYSLENLPAPKDKRITFRMTKPEQRVVIRFSGFATSSNLAKHLNQLESFVRDQNLNVIHPHYYAFYDDPFTLPFWRRNEIGFVVAQ